MSGGGLQRGAEQLLRSCDMVSLAVSGDLRLMTEKPVRRPAPAAIAEAKANPGGWVYEIYGNFGPEEHVPGSAIIGAWKVDDSGTIVGEFIPNPNFVMPEPDEEDDPA